MISLSITLYVRICIILFMYTACSCQSALLRFPRNAARYDTLAASSCGLYILILLQLFFTHPQVGNALFPNEGVDPPIPASASTLGFSGSP